MPWISWVLPLFQLVLLSVLLGARKKLAFLEHAARRAARRPVLSLLLPGAAAFGLAVFFSLLSFPVPFIHDEWSYLLAADTFAHGRLTQPTHPCWVQFETFHVLQHPTYQSKYPPGQGLLLALGQLIAHPIVGVWLEAGLAAIAVTWMLQAWLPRRHAVLGSWLWVLHPLPVTLWSQSYWGGSLAVLGGALVLGALPRLVTRPRTGSSLLMGLGLVTLAATRPFEGFILSLPVAWKLLREIPRKRALLPLALVLALGGAGLAFYNARVTGSPWRMPYQAYSEEYGGAVFVFQKLPPVPAFRHDVFRKFALDYERDLTEKQRSLEGLVELSATKIGTVLNSFGLLLCVPLLAVFARGRSRLVRFGVVTAAFFMGALLLEAWVWPHYAAPILPLLLALSVQGLRLLRLWRPSLARSIPIVLVLSFPVLLAAQATRERPRWALERARIERELEAKPGLSLVLVRYEADHSPHEEWVENRADIDGSRVVWARDMGEEKNRELLSYFKERSVYELDADRSELRPLH